MKRLIVTTLALTFLSVGSATAQPPPAEDAAAKRQDIQKLLETTGAAKLGIQVVTQMLTMFKQQHPDVPETVWDEFMREFNAESLMDLVIPIYEKHLTHEDIKGLIAFNESPLGRKVNSVMPTVMQESMEAGQQWGMEIAQRVQQKLEARQKDPHGE